MKLDFIRPFIRLGIIQASLASALGFSKRFLFSISVFLFSFSLRAQTFVESFLKNRDSIAVLHNGKGQEMIPVVRVYLFADSLVPDRREATPADCRRSSKSRRHS